MGISTINPAIKLKQIELQDRKKFETAYSRLKMPLADQSFPMIFIWNRILGIRWAEINGNLCVFADFEGSTVLWGPVIGGGKLKETLDECFRMLDGMNKGKAGTGAEPKLCYLPEELADEYSGIEGYALQHQNQDYIYIADEIAGLKGAKYAKKRNLANRFIASHQHMVEEYDEKKHMNGCIELLRSWEQQKSDEADIESVQFQFRTEMELAMGTIRLAGKLGLKGLVVSIDGKIQGMAFGDRLNEETCSIIVEKTNHSIKGLPEFIFPEFVKRCWKGCKYANAQEDMGVDCLKRAKMSYHPFRLLKSYTVTRG